MIGELISVENGPQRNVKILVSPTELYSQISEPSGTYLPQNIAYYEIRDLQEHDSEISTITFVMTDNHKALFYSTHSKFDLGLLLDELDSVIGTRRRVMI
ncbi:MAG: hypothetical protein B9S32_10645 [Verrucomicrobia bacterium Tous-C9LFEB]|nr:MAG: hypothetical protein B9S32_10645 [Verrucomicrobia bacterium Tous-C9LFEB]